MDWGRPVPWLPFYKSRKVICPIPDLCWNVFEPREIDKRSRYKPLPPKRHVVVMFNQLDGIPYDGNEPYPRTKHWEE